MRKTLPFIMLGFILAGISLSSCETGATLGSVGEDQVGGFPVFDTFVAPKADYFFYGVFDGHFKTWENDERAVWDTITRKAGPGDDPDGPWNTWPVYEDNIYVNVANNGMYSICKEYISDSLYKNQTRFLRREIPEERLTINLYTCLSFTDTASPNFFNPFTDDIQSIINIGAWPFSDTARGEWGAEIEYRDDRRDIWRTKTGSGNPTDSYFRITDLVFNDTTGGSQDTFAFYKVEGEFAGRLFKGTESIAITKSNFRARLFAVRPEGFN